MTYITAQLTTPLTEETNQFSLAIEQKIDSTTITMKLFTPIVNTLYLPKTYTLLKTFLPSVLRSTCFNDNGLPFAREAQKTEIGHLFEHILLEYLCEAKAAEENGDISYSGVTQWNWVKDVRGIFHIVIDLGIEEKQLLHGALKKTIALTSLILRSGQNESASPGQLRTSLIK